MTPGRVWVDLVWRLEVKGVRTWGDLLGLEVGRPGDRQDCRDAVRAAWRRGSGAA